MRRLLAGAVTALLLATVTAPQVSAAATQKPVPRTMGAELEALLDATGSGDPVSVVVTLRTRADLRGIRKLPRKSRLKAVISGLQTAAGTSQRPVRTRLRALSRQGKVMDSTPLWIVNGLAVTADPAVIRELAARPDVASVVPDAVPLVPAAGSAEPNQAAIGAPSLWNLGQTGQGVVVASLDTGVDVSHPDLAARWRGGGNSWFDPYGQHPTTPTDLSGHGTATMGVMVGGDAGGTSIGTAPGATWIAAKVFNDSGTATATAVHQAFQWVLDPDGDPTTDDAPTVVNGSWSIGAGPGCDLSFQPDVAALRAAGILPVFAAGNFGPGASTSVSPANYPESLAVGAVSATNRVVGSSSRGPSTCGGRTRVYPDLVAPGVDVYTAERYGMYQYASGTSLAAPHAAGALALLLGARPGLTADEQLAALTGTARDLGTAGPDPDYGSGLLDAVAAYQSLGPPPPPPADFGLTLAPAEAGTTPGGTATWTVQVTAVNGFSGDVSLSASGPGTNQATSTFDPAVVTAGSGQSQLALTTSPAAAPGSYPLTVTAVGGGLTRTADAALVLTAPVVPESLELSTLGNTKLPGVSGTADDADIYRWSGSAYSRAIDVSAAPYKLPSGANVDGFDRLNATQFYLSFSNTSTTVPGIGTVQDEDVLFWDGSAWSVFFDGTAHGLTSSSLDIDAISVAGSTLYFSTFGNTNPPGVGGTADDADIYSWNGTSYARVWDATANGLSSAANVDGYVRVDATHFYLSFSPTTTTVPGLGAVEDEDVVYTNGGTWSVFFDGTAHGLTPGNLDVDAFDVV